MSDVKFFLKLLAITAVLVLAMQIQVGDDTIETHAMEMVHDSPLFTPVNKVATGATKLIRDGSAKVYGAIGRNQGKRRATGEKKSRAFRWFESEPSTTDAQR